MRYFRYFFTALLIFLASLLIYSKFKDYSYDIPQLFREANKWLIGFLILFQIFAYGNNAWLSKILFKIAGFDIKLKDALAIAVLSILGGQLAPLFGSMAITFLFYKKMNLPSGTILFLVTTWNFVVVLVHIFFFLLSLIFIPQAYFHIIPQQVIQIALIFTLALIIGGYFLLKNQGKGFVHFLDFLNKLLNKVSRFFSKKDLIHTARPKKFVEEFFHSLTLLFQNKKDIPSVLLTSTMFYLANIATLYFSFMVFGSRPEITVLIFGYTVALVLSIFSLMPETPGVMEACLILVFVALGFPSHIALFATLLYRLFAYWLPLPLGIFAYFKLKKSA
jgi:uncharacterized protein (TIRG00374 family)